MMATSSSSTGAPSSSTEQKSDALHTIEDSYLRIDEAKLQALRQQKPWSKDVKYFNKVKISAAAAMKMDNEKCDHTMSLGMVCHMLTAARCERLIRDLQTTHAQSGVEKGLKSSNAMPVEVMGLMHGHVDTTTTEDCGSRTLIVTDVFPLPVEGTETMVMSDNEEVTNYMVRLTESLEHHRGEHLMGWYHSHPFDVGPHSNAFLSATDVSTQLMWQTSEDAAGNPWLALVVDPLRSFAKGRPEIGAFRCYPPSYTPPKGMAPDGVTWSDEKARNDRWGMSCLSYYQLQVEYFTSSLSGGLLDALAREFMWARTLSSTPGLGDGGDVSGAAALPAALRAISDKLSHASSKASMALTEAAVTGGGHGMGGMGGGALGGGGGGMTSLLGEFKRSSLSGGQGGGGPGGGSAAAHMASQELKDAAAASQRLASSLARDQVSQLVKHAVFNSAASSGSSSPEKESGSGISLASALRTATEVSTGAALSQSHSHSHSPGGGCCASASVMDAAMAAIARTRSAQVASGAGARGSNRSGGSSSSSSSSLTSQGLPAPAAHVAVDLEDTPFQAAGASGTGADAGGSGGQGS